jgi:hypothetical protein
MTPRIPGVSPAVVLHGLAKRKSETSSPVVTLARLRQSKLHCQEDLVVGSSRFGQSAQFHAQSKSDYTGSNDTIDNSSPSSCLFQKVDTQTSGPAPRYRCNFTATHVEDTTLSNVGHDRRWYRSVLCNASQQDAGVSEIGF